MKCENKNERSLKRWESMKEADRVWDPKYKKKRMDRGLGREGGKGQSPSGAVQRGKVNGGPVSGGVVVVG